MIKKLVRRYKSAYQGLPAAAWWLSLVIFVNRSGTMVMFFMTLYATVELNLTETEAGFLLSCYGLGAMVGAFLGGWASDKYGAWITQIISLATGGIALIVLAYLTTPLHIAAALFVTAMLAESFRPANSAALAHICPPDLRARGFALNRLAINLGVTIGPAFGGLLAVYSYTYLFWVDGITCLLASVLIWWVFTTEELGHGESKREAGGSEASVFKDYWTLAFIGLVFCCGLIFVQLFSSWPYYLKTFNGFQEGWIGLLMGLNAFLIVLIEMPLVHALENRDEMRIVTLGAACIFLGFALTPLFDSIIYIAFTVMVWTLGEILLFPIASSIVANRSRAGVHGKYMGMLNFAMALALIVGPALGMSAMAYLDGVAVWYAAIVLGGLTVAGLSLLRAQIQK